jgi:V8-like Glu-specific endopeptidase
MASILDTSPYPWPDPEAQQLYVTLYQIHSTSQAARSVVQKAGIDTSFIFFDQAIAYAWREVLDHAAVQGQCRQLVRIVNELLNSRSPSKEFIEALLQNAAAPIDPEPRGDNGEPRFLRHDDQISEPEALLFEDDLTIPVTQVPALIDTLKRMDALSHSVCQLLVDCSGRIKHATGFRIGDDLLLTNWHVFHFQSPYSRKLQRATAGRARFGFNDDGVDAGLKATPVDCDVGSIIADQQNDWAVVRVKGELPAIWPIVKLSEAVDPVVDSTALIIQHPGGGGKRLGYVRNQVVAFDEQCVHYLTDTQQGSSGAPVFNSGGRLIALHHAGGRPQQVVGKALPLKRNEGIRIARILDGLASQKVVVP